MTKLIGKNFTLDVSTDDRGRIVAEVWHNDSGATLGITEVDTKADALHWARRTIESYEAKAAAE